MSKTALVTGASRGIGAACAIALAQDGYRVIVNYNKDEAAARRVAEMCGGAAIRADVADRAAVDAMLEQAGRVDTLVLCAGVAHYGLFTDIAERDWRRVLDVNLGGYISCAQAVIPGMVREKRGCIIATSSIWGISGASCEAVYSASKAGVIGLTRSLAKELGPSGIRVNCVAPGVINTDMIGNLTADDIADLRVNTPLGRIGEPEDVAGLVRFLASDSASFITGQAICVDGGFQI